MNVDFFNWGAEYIIIDDCSNLYRGIFIGSLNGELAIDSDKGIQWVKIVKIKEVSPIIVSKKDK